MLGEPPGETRTTLARCSSAPSPTSAPTSSPVKGGIEGTASEYVAEHRVRTRSGEWIWVLSHGTVAGRDDR
jgi:hypothetical protein